jgi:uncharacterized membrane protein
MKKITTFFITGAVLLSMDLAYLKFIAPIFGKMVQNIQGSPMKVRWYSAAVAYFLLTLGVTHFIIIPNKSILEASFLGLVIYGVYDFTNHATINKYTLKMSIQDSIWGATLCALTTAISKKLNNYLN